MHRLTHLTRVATLGGLLALAACDSTRDLFTTSLSGNNEIFRSYVALGNSITAGYQRGGINAVALAPLRQLHLFHGLEFGGIVAITAWSNRWRHGGEGLEIEKRATYSRSEGAPLRWH